VQGLPGSIRETLRRACPQATPFFLYILVGNLVASYLLISFFNGVMLIVILFCSL
jgi:hypothetical protein